MVDLDKIEHKIDGVKASTVEISGELGGIQIKSLDQLFKVADAMSRGKYAVPDFLKNNPGDCTMICMLALEWRLSLYGVANKCYVASGKIAYEAQLVHAIINSRAPLKGRLRDEILGEGDERRCRVWGMFNGETEPHSFTSETLKTLHPGHNENGRVKGSQLWDLKPELQLKYNATRDWARSHCPEVILGIYSDDELPEMRDITPPQTPPSGGAGLLERLKANRQDAMRGFDAAHVERTVRANGGKQEERENEGEGRTSGGNGDEIRAEGGDADVVVDRGPDDAGAGDRADSSDREAGGGAAGSGEAGEAQQELIPPDDAGRKAGKAGRR